LVIVFLFFICFGAAAESAWDAAFVATFTVARATTTCTTFALTLAAASTTSAAFAFITGLRLLPRYATACPTLAALASRRAFFTTTDTNASQQVVKFLCFGNQFIKGFPDGLHAGCIGIDN